MFISYKIKKQNRKIDNKENEIVIKLLRRFTAFRKWHDVRIGVERLGLLVGRNIATFVAQIWSIFDDRVTIFIELRIWFR